MLLTIDIGNTHIASGVFSDQNLISHWRISTDLKKTEDEYAVILSNLFSMDNLDLEKVKGAIVESVVPHLTWNFKKTVNRLFHFDPLVMTHDTDIGLVNRYDNPQEVGMDRLANAVGGKAALGAPVIIVDFGTAITLDLVDRDGAYAGGIIMPGQEMSADSLFKRTSRLPRISLIRPPRVLGASAVASMQSGLFYGTIGAVETLIRRIWDEAGYKTKVAVTGGGAVELVKEIPLVDLFDPYLTLRGLELIWLHNSGSRI
ncbi:type III pantothenate kinase [Candidatus Sumerlaeota bacterium]|nr:type III pantothenate kinase [Candidatus Sumerlaeota bacterium]